MAIASSLLDERVSAAMTDEQLQLIGNSVLAEAIEIMARDPSLQKRLQDRAEGLANTMGRAAPSLRGKF
jgi:hypothetical protein